MNTAKLLINDNKTLIKSYTQNIEYRMLTLEKLFKNILTSNNIILYEELVRQIKEGKLNTVLVSPHFTWWWQNLNLKIRSKNKSLVNNWFEYINWMLNVNMPIKSDNGKLIAKGSIFSIHDTQTYINELEGNSSFKIPQLAYEISLGLKEDPWLNQFINRINEKQPIDPYPLDLIEVHEFSNKKLGYINESLNLIQQITPGLLNDIKHFVKMIVLIKCKYISNFTDKSFNGAIFLSECVCPYSDLFITAEHIIHESAHIKLNYILLNEKLILAPSDYLVNSPFRKDKRPLEGLLHAVFVYENILIFWKALLANKIGDFKQVTTRIEDVSGLLNKGLDELNNHKDYFSDNGKGLLEKIKSTVNGGK